MLRETFHELDTRPRADTAIVQRISRECTTALSTHRRGRAAIQGLISDRSKRVVVMTVNFDQLIETDIEDQCLVLSTPEQFALESDKVAAYLAGDETQRVPVLKIHGSIDDPTTLVATIDSTAPGLHNDIRAVLDQVVSQGPPPTPWIWVGCSMRDRDVNAWLQSIAHGQLDEWWVDPFPGASLDEFVRLARDPAWTQSYRTLQDRLVIDTSDRFLERLRDHLR